MATYVIGDIHGRFETLEALLSQLPFRPEKDHLWLTGDLVNRGPRSLDVLRWAYDSSRRLGDRMVVVLGNHDLHLLNVHLGLRPVKPKDADLLPILEAEDRQQLADWLIRRPLLHRHGKTLLVHAGLLPDWTPKAAAAHARRVSKRLRNPKTVAALLGPRPEADAEALPHWLALEALTRVRTVDRRGRPYAFSGPPQEAPSGCVPWFAYPQRRSSRSEILFGHWAALGIHRQNGTTCLDSGCAWGGHLSALRLDDRELFQQNVLESAPRPGAKAPG